jgi:hypothetical protein
LLCSEAIAQRSLWPFFDDQIAQAARTMLPFTQDQFFAVFAAYNEATWPAPVVAYILAAGCMFAVAARNPHASRFVVGVLAVLWLWTGIGYHWLFFAKINPAALAFAVLFCIQGLLFVMLTIRPQARASRRPASRSILGWVLVGYATILYPLIGQLLGHAYPSAPVFGVTPCPLVIFTFGMLLLSGVRRSWPCLVIPVLWAVIGGTAAVLLEVAQDWMLPISAALFLVSLRVNREPEQNMTTAQ